MNPEPDAYAWLEDHEGQVKRLTLSTFPDAISAWKNSLHLRSSHFFPGRSLELSDPATKETLDDLYLSSAKHFRALILGWSVGASKQILECINSGNYSSAFTLERAIGEAARRCLYARLRPEDSLRWIPEHWLNHDTIEFQFVRATTETPSAEDWKIVDDRLQNCEERAIHSALRKQNGILNSHVHPTLESSSHLHLDGDRFKTSLSPFFNRLPAARAFRYGLIREMALLFETNHLLSGTLSGDSSFVSIVNDELVPQVIALAKEEPD